jgi:hypothetical protein
MLRTPLVYRTCQAVVEVAAEEEGPIQLVVDIVVVVVAAAEVVVVEAVNQCAMYLQVAIKNYKYENAKHTHLWQWTSRCW